MSIPSAVWTCPNCGFETDFPKSPHRCLLKDCPHQGLTVRLSEMPTTHSSDPALWDDAPPSFSQLSEATKKELEAIDASLRAGARLASKIISD